MKRLKKKYEKIPRQIRTAIHLGMLPLLALIIYIVIQTPVFSGTIALRLAEKANMVGPGRILDRVALPYSDYEIIVAEDADGYILCQYHTNNPFAKPRFAYREKKENGELTLLAFPSQIGTKDNFWIPLILFCDDPNVTDVFMEMTISIPYDGEIKTFHYASWSYPYNGFYELFIDICNSTRTEAEAHALTILTTTSSPLLGRTDSRDSAEIRATVTLFSNVQECRTEELTIQSVADDAFERFGNP